jgi:hypothetical protein
VCAGRARRTDGRIFTSKARSVVEHGEIEVRPLAGRQAIERSGAQAGDDVRILKSHMGPQTVFTAQVVQETPVVPAHQPAPAMVRNGERKTSTRAGVLSG